MKNRVRNPILDEMPECFIDEEESDYEDSPFPISEPLLEESQKNDENS